MPFYFSSMDEVKESELIPLISKRQKALLGALYSGSIVRIYLLLLQYAEEDLKMSDLKLPVHKRKTVFSMMTKFINDRKSGKFEILKLLLTLPPEVVEALILNIIGHRFRTDGRFENLCYKLNNSAGVYINTPLLKNTKGEFLNYNEWSNLLHLMKRYFNNEGLKVSRDSSTEDKNIMAEAIRIDNAYGTRTNMTTGVPYEPAKGDRFFVSSASKPDIFWHKQNARARIDLDPTGVVRQIQSPIECGISRQLQTRMGAHDAKSDMGGTTKPWGLMLSCLKILHIKVDIVSLAVLKVWNMDQLKLGEILITMLSSSLVEDGGFNPNQAGTSGGGNRDIENFSEEFSEVFIRNPYLADNIQPVTEELEALLKGQFTKDDKSLSKDAQSLQERVAQTYEEIDQVTQEIHQNRKQLEEENKQVEEDTERAEKELRDLQAQWQFHSHLQDWISDLK